MQLVQSSEEKYGEADYIVIEGGVRGLYTLMEGIVIIDPIGNYYIGSIIGGGEKVRIYTNDPAYKNKTHELIDEWRSRFKYYPVEYRFKEI